VITPYLVLKLANQMLIIDSVGVRMELVTSSTVSGNTIEGHEQAIKLINSTSNAFSANTIQNNKYSITLDSGCNNNNIDNNTIANNEYGLIFFDVDAITAVNNQIQNNVPADPMLVVDSIGIRMELVTGSIVSGNTIEGHEKAIGLMNSTGNTFSTNTIQNNKYSITLDAGCSSNDIDNNTIANN